MFLTAKTIRRLIKNTPPLISVDTEKRQEWEKQRLLDEIIEGSCFDLTLDRIEKQIEDDNFCFLGKTKRIVPTTEPISTENFLIDGREIEIWKLLPGNSYLCQSLETINLPPWLMGIVHARSTIFRGNGVESCTFIKPGYSGRITTEIHPIQKPILFEKGAKFCSVAFAMFQPDDYLTRLENLMDNKILKTISYETEPYIGIWGNNKLTTEGKTERGF